MPPTTRFVSDGADQDEEREHEGEDEEQEGRHRVEDGGGEIAPEVPDGEKGRKGEGDEDHKVQHPLRDDDGDGVPDGEPGTREPVNPDGLAADLTGGDRACKEGEELGDRHAPERHGVAEPAAENPDPGRSAEDCPGAEPDGEDDGGDADLAEIGPRLRGEGRREEGRESRAADHKREHDPAPALHTHSPPHRTLIPVGITAGRCRSSRLHLWPGRGRKRGGSRREGRSVRCIAERA
jgi:hypothetical protein